MNQLQLILKRTGENYSCERRCGNLRAESSDKLKLGPKSKIEVHNGTSATLEQLCESLQGRPLRGNKSIVWNEGCQFSVGKWLSRQVLEPLREDERRWLDASLAGRDGVSVVIQTTDDHLVQLPWPLLVVRETMLIASGGTVGLCGSEVLLRQDCELPPSARWLIAVPEPVRMANEKKTLSLAPTGARDHLRELANELAPRDPNVRNPGRWQEVTGWLEFQDALKNWKPDVVYYFGHGFSAPAGFRLLFQAPDHTAHEVSALDIQNVLAPPGISRPLLMYFNCCEGGTGAQMSLGSRLGQLLPALLTNRTSVYRNSACAQAISFWKKILLDGMAPHFAAGEVYRLHTDEEFMSTNPRWFNPLFYRGYREWKSKPVRGGAGADLDPHWRLKLDRTQQYAHLTYEIQAMLQNPTMRGRSFVWSGSEHSGLNEFHERIERELPRQLAEVAVVTRSVEWAPELANGLGMADRDRIFDNMICHAFGGVNSLDEIPARLAREVGPSAKSTLLYFRHPPLRQERVDLEILRGYLEFLDALAAKLRPNQYALVGISYRVEMEAALEELAGQCDFTQTVVTHLKPLAKVTAKDLVDFFQRFAFPVLPNQRKALAAGIIQAAGGDAKTGAEYRRIIEELEKFLEKRNFR